MQIKLGNYKIKLTKLFGNKLKLRAVAYKFM